MKYSNTALKELSARYAQVLRKCALLNAVILLGVAFAAPAMAASVEISSGQTFSGGNNDNEGIEDAAGLTLSYGDSLSQDGVDGVTFFNNSSVNSGGAMKALNGFTAGDGWTFNQNSSGKISGGLYVKIPQQGADNYPGDELSNRKVIFGDNTTFTNNSSEWLGGALGIETAESVTIGSAEFSGNSSEADGGAIAIWTDKSNGSTTGTTLTLGKTTFTGNHSTNRGGAIANLNNDKADNKTDFYNEVHVGAESLFDKNYAQSGGAIYNLGDMTFGENVTFGTNHVTKIGGAIYNAGTIGDMVADFTGNYAEATKDSSTAAGTDVYAQGGAIYNTGSIGTITGDFSNNYVHTTAANASKATANGGALALYQSTIKGIAGNFDGNKAIAKIAKGGSTDYAPGSSSIVSAGGGAIHIEGKFGSGEATKIGSITGDFTNNSAQGDGYANGGAIYIKAGKNTDVSINKITGKFESNTVVATTADTDVTKASTGGAISIKEDGKKATVSVSGDFTQNSVTTNATKALGGAVYNEGTFTVAGDFTNNSASSTSGQAEGGAIYNSGKLTLESGAQFTSNEATNAGGAIRNNAGEVTAADATFSGNSADKGGAVYNSGEVSHLALTNATFSNNTADVDGGAIYNGNSATIESLTGTFTGNNAILSSADTGRGGAIYNAKSSAIKNITATFSGNNADKGGAISNAGTITISGSSFTGNIASNQDVLGGGAIHNMAGATISLTGNNVFSGNLANGKLNDIYNNGTLNVAGNLTLDGGISGAGSVVFDDNTSLTATLNTTTILANSVSIGSDSTLNLIMTNITEGGKYDFIKADSVNGSFTIADNNLYDMSMNDNGSIQVTQKDTAAIAETTGATGVAADTIVAVTSGTSGVEAFDTVAESIHTMLQSSDADVVAAGVQAAKALAPVEAPIHQAQATQTVSQILAAAGSRLSGGSTVSMGESSGDMVSGKGAVWAKGLYNKSKYTGTDGFDAYSQGIALGAEAQITDAVKVGLGYAYTNSDIKPDLRKTEIDSNSALLYAEYKPSNWYVNGIASYTWGRYDEHRYSLTDVTSKYDVDTLALQAMTGYDIHMNALTLTPEAGLRYMNIQQQAYTDSIGDRIHSGSSDILTGVLGAKAVYDWKVTDTVLLKPEVRAAVTYDFVRDNAATVMSLANGAVISTEGKALKRFGTEFAVGLTTDIADNMELGLFWEGKFRNDYTDNTGMINLKYNF